MLVAPVGPHGAQSLLRYDKGREAVAQTTLAPARFAPILAGIGGGGG